MRKLRQGARLCKKDEAGGACVSCKKLKYKCEYANTAWPTVTKRNWEEVDEGEYEDDEGEEEEERPQKGKKAADPVVWVKKEKDATWAKQKAKMVPKKAPAGKLRAPAKGRQNVEVSNVQEEQEDDIEVGEVRVGPKPKRAGLRFPIRKVSFISLIHRIFIQFYFLVFRFFFDSFLFRFNEAGN